MIRAPDEPYSEYIDRVGQNRIARCIKLADLRHEIDPGRFDMITKQDMAQISRCRAGDQQIRGHSRPRSQDRDKGYYGVRLHRK